MKKERNHTVLSWVVVFLAIFLCFWLKPSSQYSFTERRKLAQFPEVSIESIADGTFMTEFEEYALDQFPFRENLRALKAWVSENVFRKSDHNQIYTADGHAVKMEYPLNRESLAYAGERFREVYELYLKNSESRIYFSVIPDKNYFLAEKTGHLSMDYEELFRRMQKEMPYADYVDITGLLTIEDYYQTDVHWRQERIRGVAECLGEAMNLKLGESYEERTLGQEFYGVYFGQSALDLPGEKLHYLTNETLDQCIVHNYESNQTTGIYDMEKAQGKDPYEIYLSGPVSLMQIENPNAETDRGLIVFRDSFGSSLIPLLAEGYEKITLIDLRYIQGRFLGDYVAFKNQDVLFLYSTTVLNNSETLK